ncbi:protein with unknown function [Ricinus communis]|uniref:IST1-like protein n=1 Tax=Ricinus communis TaxID=3988 RepID=B9RSK9_RICCO|nr:protein with unknown function [Ricinus communis]
MERKLAALLRKSFKISKFRYLISSAISRLAYIQKQHKIRCSQARADVVQLLNVGQQERALLRVEHVIREQNMLDAYDIIDNYCHLLMERVVMLENKKKCPDELKEAISSLIFAASRCGELPEMQKIRCLFESRFGKEFTTRAAELRNNCGVNPKIAKKLVTRQPSLDSKLKTLNEIAPTSLQLERKASTFSEKYNVNKKEIQPIKYMQSANAGDPYSQEDIQNLSMKLKPYENFSETTKERKKYRDVGAAARAAFRFAAHAAAAAAARASVEVSQPRESPDSQNSSIKGRYAFNFDEAMISKLHVDENPASGESKNKHPNDSLDSGKANGILGSKAGTERIADNNNFSYLIQPEERKKEAEIKKVFIQIDDGATLRKQNEKVMIQTGESGFNGECSLKPNERLRNKKPDEVADRDLSDEIRFQILKENPLIKADPIKGISGLEYEHHKDFAEKMISRNSKVGRRPLSMRTRRMHRQ